MRRRLPPLLILLLLAACAGPLQTPTPRAGVGSLAASSSATSATDRGEPAVLAERGVTAAGELAAPSTTLTATASVTETARPSATLTPSLAPTRAPPGTGTFTATARPTATASAAPTATASATPSPRPPAVASAPQRSATSVPNTPSTVASSPVRWPDGCASWEQVAQHAGRAACICGPVKGANFAEGSKGKPVFLDVGEAYPSPRRFTILIWGEHRGAFPAPPEQFYMGKNVCVRGTVTEYKGSMEAEAQSAGDVQVLN